MKKYWQLIETLIFFLLLICEAGAVCDEWQYSYNFAETMEQARDAAESFEASFDCAGDTLCDINPDGFNSTARFECDSCSGVDQIVPRPSYCWLWPIKLEEECCKAEEGACCPEGMAKCPNDKRGNPVSVVSGENKEKETDLAFNTPHAKGFKLYRSYGSQSELNTTIGHGWTHNYNVTFEVFIAPGTNAYQITDEQGRSHYYQDNDHDGVYTGILLTQGSLVEELDGSFVWYRPNDVQYTFNADRQFIAKADGHGNVQNLTYNADGLLETVTDQATGRSIGFVYNTDGRIDHLTGPTTPAVSDGIWVRYEYDASGNLTRVIYADNANGSTASGFEYHYEDPSR